jgi:hypothetical protein
MRIHVALELAVPEFYAEVAGSSGGTMKLHSLLRPTSVAAAP